MAVRLGLESGNNARCRWPKEHSPPDGVAHLPNVIRCHRRLVELVLDCCLEEIMAILREHAYWNRRKTGVGVGVAAGLI